MTVYRKHIDLLVFQEAVEGSQGVFAVSRSFPKEGLIPSRIRFGGHQGALVPILQKHGANVDRKYSWSARSTFQRWRQPKFSSGCSLLLTAATTVRKRLAASTVRTTKSLHSSFI